MTLLNDRSSLVKLPFRSVPYSGQPAKCEEIMRDHENRFLACCRADVSCLADICDRTTITIRELPFSIFPNQDSYQDMMKRWVI